MELEFRHRSSREYLNDSIELDSAPDVGTRVTIII